MNKPTLVVMAAGLGSRYGGLKQIDPVGPSGQIILDYTIYDAAQAGFSRVIFIVRPELHEMFEQTIGQRARCWMQVEYAYQTLDRLPAGLCVPAGREKPLGTAHAVWCAREQVKGVPIAVVNADDFYGAQAFEQVYRYLEQGQQGACCMVGYRVENTLTEHGTVSRGVCTTDEHGMLTSIVERTAIARAADGRIVYTAEGGQASGELAPDTPVSMNLWGFSADVLPALDRGMARFITQTLPQNPLKAEYYLPYAVEELLAQGKVRVRVLTTEARWFGVTYQQDKQAVCEAIAQLTAQGKYPA